MNPNKKLVPVCEEYIFEASKAKGPEENIKEFKEMGFSAKQAKDLCEKKIKPAKAQKLFDNAENEALTTVGGVYKYLMGKMSKADLEIGKRKFQKNAQKK